MLQMEVNEIIAKNIAFYDSIKPPSRASEYTVLATINDHDTGQLLALATGTKANLKVYPNDIEDCHAESLLKRAYKRYILDQLLYSKSSDKSETTNYHHHHQLIKSESQRKLLLFISQLPCGLVQRYEGEPLVDLQTGQPIERKPGRGQDTEDGRTVYVLRDCCFTKLKRWISTTGLQGRTFGEKLSLRSNLTGLFIGNCEQEPDFEYQPRLDTLESQLPSNIRVDKIDMRRDEFVYSPDKQPQPVALVWWARPPPGSGGGGGGSINGGNCEFVVDGRKRGLTKRQCTSFSSRKFLLKISDHQINADLNSIMSP